MKFSYYSSSSRIACSILILAGAACKKEESSKKPPATDAANERVIEEKDSSSPRTDTKSTLSDLKYVVLPGLLGRLVPPEITKRLETDGQTTPELQNITGKGMSPAVLDLHGTVKAVVYVKDGELAALGYLFQIVPTEDDKKLERNLLQDYTPTGTEKRNALGLEYEAVQITIQKHQNKLDSNIHAAIFTHGRARTLVFFDSSAVHLEQLLPATPEIVGKEKIEKMRNELKRAKELIEAAKIKSTNK